ncbi:MAG: extracellular solute-binding protein [Pseudomonadota bacterium]
MPKIDFHWGVAELRAVALAVLGGALAASAAADSHEDIIVSHGYSFFGDLKYPVDFPHFAYVNPDAPKGGDISQWAPGTFDSFNNYTRQGRAAALSTIGDEDMMIAAADDVGALYCLLCETIEYPESIDWVIFNLRPEVAFSDGRPATAHDFKFAFDMFMSEGLPSFRSAFGAFVADVEVLGEHRIKYTFTPDSPVRDRIGLAAIIGPIHQDWMQETGLSVDDAWSDGPMPGTGPYVLESFDVSRRIVYARNPNYWGEDLPINRGRNNFDRIRVEYFADGGAALEGFKAGTYTFRNENSSKNWATGYERFPALEAGDVIKTELASGAKAPGQGYVFNLRREKFQDARVREAIKLMFNFEWSNEQLFFGLYERIDSLWENSDLSALGVPTPEERVILEPLVSQGLLEASILTNEAILAPTSGMRQLDRRNLRRASALLDEAGWEVGDDGKRRKGGQLLTVEILDSSPAFDRVHNPFVSNLQALGIEARLDRVDPPQETNRRRAYDFDLTVHSINMPYEPSTGLKQWFSTEAMEGSTRNLMGLSDPAVDSLVETVIAATTTDELNASVKALDRVLRTKSFWIPQWYKDTHTVAYFDQYEHPDPLPPLALGVLDFWWYNADKGEDLRTRGVLN